MRQSTIAPCMASFLLWRDTSRDVKLTVLSAIAIACQLCARSRFVPISRLRRRSPPRRRSRSSCGRPRSSRPRPRAPRARPPGGREWIPVAVLRPSDASRRFPTCSRALGRYAFSLQRRAPHRVGLMSGSPLRECSADANTWHRRQRREDCT